MSTYTKKAILSYHCNFIYTNLYSWVVCGGSLEHIPVYTKKKLVLNYLHITMASFNHMTIRLKIDLLNTYTITI